MNCGRTLRKTTGRYRFIQDTFPGIKGFNRRSLYRMKQFYETYANYEKVSPLVTQINWTNNLLILSGTKSIEEKEFYLRLCIRENYSKRELDRQVKKEHENPSVGLILCATKNDEVVEYAMSRSMSPMLVSEYKLQLLDKKILQEKLQELINISE